MRPLAPFLRKPAAFGLALSLAAAVSPGRAETPAVLPARIEMLWTTPITAGTTTADFFRGEGLVLRAGAAAPGGAMVALGARLDAQGSIHVLLPDTARTGPDGAVPLELARPRTWLSIPYRPIRAPAVLSLAVGGRGEVWLGGFSNSSQGFLTDSCDAYVAVLDRGGKPVWERAHSAGTCSRIEGIAPAATGGAVVVGRQYGRSSWLASIAPDGRLLAERRFGNGKGAAVAPLPDGRFVVAGFTSRGEAATYQDDVAVWLWSGAGELHGPVRIREAVDRSRGSYFGRVAASAAAGGAYVASSWGNPSDPRRFDREAGTMTAARLPLPDCQRPRAADLFLVAHQDGTVFLGGSRPGNNGRASCSWLGRLTLRAD